MLAQMTQHCRAVNLKSSAAWAKLAFSGVLCVMMIACGGGGGSPPAASNPVDENYQLLTAYTSLINSNKSKTYSVSGTIAGLSYSAAGIWTTATTNSLFNNSFAYAQKITYNESSVTVGGLVQAPAKTESIVYYDSNYRLIGAQDKDGIQPIDQIKYFLIPSVAKVGESSALLEYSSYSDSAKKNLAGVVSDRWAIENDSSSPTGAVLIITRTVVFADKVSAPNPLVYTDRYSITKSGVADVLTRNISFPLPSGSTNYTYTFR
jgi:hypothetical protein